MKVIGISGLGVVGNAMYQSLLAKKYILNKDLFIYDKYKGNYLFDALLETDILFLALPTQYDSNNKTYCLDPITETLDILKNKNYKGIIVIKSTVLPQTVNLLAEKYNLNLVHNPEFLTARTALEDLENQKHIVLGKAINCDDDKFDSVVEFYKINYPNAEISICTATESESMKIFLNTFYATKVQFFTEIYLLCNKLNINYNIVKELMLKNDWINPMHTNIPGPDGKISYGGLCFPKDTNAINQFMKNLDVPHAVLNAVIEERNEMRDEQENII